MQGRHRGRGVRQGGGLVRRGEGHVGRGVRQGRYLGRGYDGCRRTWVRRGGGLAGLAKRRRCSRVKQVRDLGHRDGRRRGKRSS